MAIALLFSTHSRLVRAAFVTFVGSLVVLVAINYAPQCLANPYDPLHPEVASEWLGRISESKSLFGIIAKGRLDNFGFVVIPIIAGLYAVYSSRDQAYRMRSITLFLILVGAYAMMFYQIRGLFFLLQLCAIPLAAMVGRAYGNYKETKAPLSGVIFIVLLFGSIPNTWILGVGRFGESDSEPEIATRSGSFQDCKKQNEFESLHDAPVGTVAASTDLGVMVMLNTPHSAISANFHRNHDGILANIELMKADMSGAETLLNQWNVDYVVFCDNDFATKSWADEYPNGLWYSLYRGDVPDFLTPVVGMEDGLIHVYKTQL